jgi:predicted DsbA family dithiol-disulfide isomerase
MDTQLIHAAPPQTAVELDLIADFACPWSFLGKRSLERALGKLHGAPIRALRWHGFRGPGQLVAATQSWREHLAGRLPKGVTVEFAERSLAEAGRGLGIAFDFSRLDKLPDTSEAHRLVKLATRDERQSEVAERLFSAFFEHGRDIADHAVLSDVGVASNLTSATLAAFDDAAEGRDEVVAEERRLHGMGVVATPNLLINGRVLVPGPADESIYVQALDQALFPELPAPHDRKVLH